MVTGSGIPEDPDGGRVGGDATDARLSQELDGRTDASSAPGTSTDEQGEPGGGPELAWWRVPAAAAAEPPPANRGTATARAGRPGRHRATTRTLLAGLVGVALGVGGATLALPGYRAAAQGYPVLATVPVSASQQAIGSPAVAVYRKLSPSIVLVTNQAAVQSAFGTLSQVDWGSGVVLNPSGYIVTNDHVVAGSQKVTVTLADGKAYPARLVGADPSSDLAVIKINPPAPLQPATFANSRDVVPGEFAVAIGNPLGPQFAQSVTAGIVSAMRPMLYGGINGTTPRVTEMIQTDAPINPGNSGGALANAQGEVIGITSMKVGQTGEANLPAVGLGFAIPSNTVQKIVDQLIRLGYVPEPWIGVALNPQPANALPSQPQTLTVEQVTAGSPAAKAGIQVGDVITGWQGQPLTNYWSLVGDINRASPGQSVVLGLKRNGQAMSIHLTLGTMPQSLATQPASSSTAPAPSGTTPAPTPYPFPFPFGGSTGQ